MTAQEEERRRISRELHDEMGQYLAALTLELKMAEQAKDQSVFVDRLQAVRHLAGEMGAEIHRLAVELRPTALDDLGLSIALANYVEEWSARTAIPVDAHIGEFQGDRPSSAIETTVYRITQEALTNVVKHANATGVSLILERHQESISLIIEDNGDGFDEDATHSSAGRMGLIGMQERVALVGGTCTIESNAGQGATVIVRIPFTGSHSDEKTHA